MAAFDAIAPIDRDALKPGNRFAAPAIVEQMDATTLVPPGMTARDELDLARTAERPPLIRDSRSG
jgi:N-methylhydantoinase A/oxoprolinase/acetone carboxylase beta subunit